MNINDFVANFAEQFEETELSVFNPATNFRDLEEWSSLIALSIIAMVDSEYGIKLTGEDIRKSNSIKDIFNIINSKI